MSGFEDAYSADKLLSLLPYPAPDANKYTRGRLVLVAGSDVYPGAACLSALAGQLMGAGYTEVVTHGSAVGQVQAFRHSLVVRQDEVWQSEKLAPAKPGHPCGYVVGPGFEPEAERSSRLLTRVLGAEAPVLVDGGALASLATESGRKQCERRFVEGAATVVTPHGGEATHLAKPLGLQTEDPQRLARELSLALGVLVVLKGPDTWISDGERLYRMDEGTPALAKAGTGDVLAGMTGSLLAQGLDPFDACVLATTLHARSACLAADALTTIAVSAEDVVGYLPQAIAALGD